MWPRTAISTMECLKVVLQVSIQPRKVSVIHIANEFIVQLKAHLNTKFK